MPRNKLTLDVADTGKPAEKRDYSVTTIQYDKEDAIRLPEGMDLVAALDVLQRRIRYEAEETVITETFEVHPYDGAHAVFEVLKARFGWAEMQIKKAESFFEKDQKPEMMNLQVG